MKTKSIAYSYPTSPNATKYGFKGGCYTVEIHNGSKPPVVASAHETIEEARKAAEAFTELPLNRYSL